MKAMISMAARVHACYRSSRPFSRKCCLIVDKSLIQYVVSGVAAGIRGIILAFHSCNNSLENHFDSSLELEMSLEKRWKPQLLAETFWGNLPLSLGFENEFSCVELNIGRFSE